MMPPRLKLVRESRCRPLGWGIKLVKYTGVGKRDRRGIEDGWQDERRREVAWCEMVEARPRDIGMD